jgi:uncharacterized protein DUF4234
MTNDPQGYGSEDSTRYGIIKHRNMWGQAALFFITLGIYAVYWYYETASEMKAVAKDPDASPGLWTFLLFVPFFNFYAHYKYSELFERVSSGRMSRWLLFVIGIVFPPAVWIIVQTDLNEKAESVMPMGT